MRGLMLVLALCVGGCASTLSGGEIEDGTGPAYAVGGLPYRERERIKVEVYQLTDKGYQLVGAGVDTLADPTRLHFLNFEGQALADTNMKVEQRPDGSLTSVHLAGKSQGPATLTAAGDAIKSYAETRVADDKAREDRDKAREDREKAEQAEAEALLAAAEQREDALVDLRYKALEAEAKLDELPDTAKRSERIAAERSMIEAKRAANRAALKAGQEKPFPDL